MQISNFFVGQPTEGMSNQVGQPLAGIPADPNSNFLALLKAAGPELPSGLTAIPVDTAGVPLPLTAGWTGLVTGQTTMPSQQEGQKEPAAGNADMALMADPALLAGIQTMVQPNTQPINPVTGSPEPIAEPSGNTKPVQALTPTVPIAKLLISADDVKSQSVQSPGSFPPGAESIPASPLPDQTLIEENGLFRMAVGETATTALALQRVQTEGRTEPQIVNQTLPIEPMKFNQSLSTEPTTAAAQTPIPTGVRQQMPQPTGNSAGPAADTEPNQEVAAERPVMVQPTSMKKAEVSVMAQPVPVETPVVDKAVKSADPEPIETAPVVNRQAEEMVQPPSVGIDALEIPNGLNPAEVKPALTNSALPAAEIRSGEPVLPETEEIFRQIVSHTRLRVREGQSEIHFHLKPEFLGEMKIAVVIEKGLVSASITTENHQVRQLIEANLPQLKQSLEDQGLRFDRLDVSLGGNSSWTGQSDQADRRAAGSRPKWSSHYTGYAEPAADAESGGHYRLSRGGTIDFLV